ncbi:hypothetical protein [Hydrocarboniphaga sp.]|uniref:hypothetical protein n=1 Tax=Hydrocarboniphaga sp. TaxID=2033016 RepID=UPI003D1298F9
MLTPAIRPSRSNFKRRSPASLVLGSGQVPALWSSLLSIAPAGAAERFTDHRQMGLKYSPLTQINAGNVDQLQAAREVHTGGHGMYGSRKGNPVMAHQLKR